MQFSSEIPKATVVKCNSHGINSIKFVSEVPGFNIRRVDVYVFTCSARYGVLQALSCLFQGISNYIEIHNETLSIIIGTSLF